MSFDWTLTDILCLSISIIFLTTVIVDTRCYPTPHQLRRSGRTHPPREEIELYTFTEYYIDCGRFLKRGLWINKVTMWIIACVAAIPREGKGRFNFVTFLFVVILVLRWLYRS